MSTSILSTPRGVCFTGRHVRKVMRNARSGGAIVVRGTHPIHIPNGGIPSLKRYVEKAEMENISVNASKDRPSRLCASGRHTTTRPISHVMYQEKNQGVIMSKPPSVASDASMNVRIVGARHNQKAPVRRKPAKTTVLIVSQVQRALST